MSEERFELEDEMGAYLLGSLSTQEEQRVEKLLEESESAREHLVYMKPAVDLLGEAVERRTPPPALRHRILVETGIAEPMEQATAKPSHRSWFRLSGFTLQPAMGLAAVLLVAVVGVVGYEVGTGGGASNNPQVFVPPPGSPHSPQLNVIGDNGTLELSNLTTLPPNRDYQAWVQRDDTMYPSSLFAVRKNGTASAAIPHDLTDAQAVVVTTEPKGGSREPTGPVVASVVLDN